MKKKYIDKVDNTEKDENFSLNIPCFKWADIECLRLFIVAMEWSGVEWSGVEWSGVE